MTDASDRFVPVPRRASVRLATVETVQTHEESVIDSVSRFAVLRELGPWAEADTTDLLVDGHGQLWRDGGGGLQNVKQFPPLESADARRLAVELIAAGGRHIDDAAPCADVRLPGGMRAHAVLAPVSTAGALISVRIARERAWRLDDLVGLGTLDAPTVERLRVAVRDRRNLLVCGPAGSGKTSLLAALLAETPADQRIVTVEDVAELAIEHPHVVGLEARQPNADGAGGIDLARLIREALRMRPDRLVLGECRGAEFADLLTALNTGHQGGGGTVHSAGIHDVPARLESLGALAGMSPEVVGRQVIGAIDLVVHLGRRGTTRVVDAVSALKTDALGRLSIADAPS